MSVDVRTLDGPGGLKAETSSDGRVIITGPEREQHLDLEPDEARWLFAIAGPSVLIAIDPHERRKR